MRYDGKSKTKRILEGDYVDLAFFWSPFRQLVLIIVIYVIFFVYVTSVQNQLKKNQIISSFLIFLWDRDYLIFETRIIICS